MVFFSQGYSGCTTYVHKQYSPTAAEADNLGSSVAAELGQDDFFGDQPDIDKEGRYACNTMLGHSTQGVDENHGGR